MLRMPFARASVLLSVMLLTALFVGCDDPPSGPPRFQKLEASYVPGIFSHDLKLVQRGLHRLRAVDLTITVYTERDESTVTRHWGSWYSGETKTVNVSAAGGRIQRVMLVGTAEAGVAREPVLIDKSIYWEYDAEE